MNSNNRKQLTLFEIKSEDGLDFTGPVDLLLKLIKKEKLDVTDLSLVKIIDQYYSFVQNNKVEIENIANFLEILVTLLLIKSRILSEKNYENNNEDDQNIEKFKENLQFMQLIQEKSNNLINLYEENGFISRKKILTIKKTNEIKISLKEIKNLKSYYDIIVRKKEKEELFKKRYEKASLKIARILQEKIILVKKFLKRESKINFNLFTINLDKTKKILSFLAFLEVYKQGNYEIYQKDIFGDIVLKSN